MIALMKEATDMTLIGPVLKEQQKIIDLAIDKKLQLSKIQSSLLQKNNIGNDKTESLGVDMKEAINKLINDRVD